MSKKSTNDINVFINTLDDAQRGYITHCLAFAKRMETVVKEYGVTKEEFCKVMGISPLIYKNFLKGGYNYDLRNMANFSSFHNRLLTEKTAAEIKEATEVIKFPKEK